MTRTVTVNIDAVVLPDGNLYNEGDSATLTDEQYARIDPGMFEGDPAELTETTTGYVTPDGDGNADLREVSDQRVRTISQYEDFDPGWKLLLQPPSAAAPVIKVLIAAQSNIDAFGLVIEDGDEGSIPYMMDSAIASALGTIDTLLVTFEPVQALADDWQYALTCVPFGNLD